MRGRGCMWLEWLLQARQGEVARRGFGESGQFEATMRVGVVLLGRLERDWMAIGIILNLSNCPLVSMSLSQSVRVEF